MDGLLVKIGSSSTEWGWLDSQLFSSGVQALAVIVAAWFGFRAIRKQIRETETRRLKSELLEQSLVASRTLSDSASAMTGLLTRLMLEIEVYAKASAAGINAPLPSVRFPMILSSYQDFSDSALYLAFLIEARQFIDPRLLVFRDAILCLLHDSQIVFHKQFPLHVMQAIPTDNPAGGVFPYTAPSICTANQVSEVCSQGLSAVADGQCVAADFQVEMQNLLAADLFGHTVEHRVPLDPKHKVFRLKDAEEQRAWLAAETDWGKECTMVDQRTLEVIKGST